VLSLEGGGKGGGVGEGKGSSCNSLFQFSH